MGLDSSAIGKIGADNFMKDIKRMCGYIDVVDEQKNKVMWRPDIDFHVIHSGGLWMPSVESKAEQVWTGNLFGEDQVFPYLALSGWFWVCRADCIYYYFIDTQQAYIFYLQQFKSWFLEQIRAGKPNVVELLNPINHTNGGAANNYNGKAAKGYLLNIENLRAIDCLRDFPAVGETFGVEILSSRRDVPLNLERGKVWVQGANKRLRLDAAAKVSKAAEEHAERVHAQTVRDRIEAAEREKVRVAKLEVDLGRIANDSNARKLARNEALAASQQPGHKSPEVCTFA